MNRILTQFALFFAALMAPAAAFADIAGDWKIYPTFNESVKQVVETDKYVYFCGLPQRVGDAAFNVPNPVMMLFCYDKEADEIIPLSTKNRLSENLVRRIEYNAQKGYLIVVYENLNVDFLYDDGKVVNMASLMTSNIQGSKNVNTISFYPKDNEVYIATDFGYVSIDDAHHEVKESRNYGVRLNSAVRFGDRIAVANAEGGYVGLLSDPRTSLGDYTPVADGFMQNVAAFSSDDNKLVTLSCEELGSGKPAQLRLLTFDPGSLTPKSVEDILDAKAYDFALVKGGICVRYAPYLIVTSGKDLSYVQRIMPQEEFYKPAMMSESGSKAWVVEPHVGLRGYSFNDSGKATLIKATEAPNAPSTFLSYNMIYNKDYGMVTFNRGRERIYSYEKGSVQPFLVAVEKDGFWKNYSPEAVDRNLYFPAWDFQGAAVDPENPNVIYRGSLTCGIVRYDLDNPSKPFIVANPNVSNSLKSYPLYKEAFPVFDVYPTLCRVKSPQFDNNGDLYWSFNNLDVTPDGGGIGSVELYRWTPQNRKPSVSPETFRPFEKITLKNLVAWNADVFLVCRHPKNKNKVMWGHQVSDTEYDISILDHKGTFSDQKDDEFTIIRSAVDQDGGSISLFAMQDLYEDPDTGNIWVLTDTGVSLFDPTKQTSGQGQFNRIKVSRNDGTSLADYLLNEVMVSHMMTDGVGRKWFSTSGGGLVCTSGDGRKILAEFTSENSWLPSDDVYSTAWNPETRSVLISTGAGVCEFFPTGGSSESKGSEVRAFPNPVSPDYYGYVTIDGVPDGSLVKITDSAGGLVRELGVAESGSIQWNLLGLDGKRVNTGVYFIFTSGGPSAESSSAVGKILVMN